MVGVKGIPSRELEIVHKRTACLSRLRRSISPAQNAALVTDAARKIFIIKIYSKFPGFSSTVQRSLCYIRSLATVKEHITDDHELHLLAF